MQNSFHKGNNSYRTKSLAKFAFFLGGGLILVALFIGFVSYQYSFTMMERSYQNFYLNKAQMLRQTIESYSHRTREHVLESLSDAWKQAGNRPPDEYICVVNEEGKLLLHSRNPDRVGSYAGDNRILNSGGELNSDLCSLVKNKENYIGEYISSDNQDQIAAFVTMPAKGWLLGIHRSQSALKKEIRDGFFPLMIGFFSVCGIFMPLALFLQYRNYSLNQKQQLQMEGELLESEQRYQSLVDTMPQYMYRTDRDGKLTFANGMLMKLLDCSKDRCLGVPLDQIGDYELGRKQIELDQEILDSGQTVNTIIEYRGSEYKHSRFMELVKCPVLNQRGQIVELQGIFWDVTDKKLAEIRLEQTKAQLQTILQSVPSGIVAVDSSGRITLVNQKAEDILNIRAEDTIGSPVREVIPGSHLCQVLQDQRTEFGRHFALGEKSLLVSRSPVKEDSTGTIGAVSVFHDESELEQVQKQLDEMKQIRDELSLLVENSHDGVLIAGTEKVLKVNPSFSRITGLAPAAVEDVRIEDLALNDHVCLHTFKNVLEHVKASANSLTVRSKLKSENEIFVTGTPVLDRANRVVRIVINIRDVTELQTLEKHIKRLSAKRLSTSTDEVHRLTGEGTGIVAESPETKRLLDVVLRVAQVDSTVLLSGESGVGKDVLAGLIHSLSPRHDKPFVSLNCGAIPAELLESELFGYDKGAFSGASSAGKPGLFEKANGGCVFLDEVAELPPALQVKLLKVLQDHKCRRLGSVKDIDLDLRIIAATNKDLKQMVFEGQFREDLFYRLYVVPLEIPPLRERREDILPLATMFLKANNHKYGLSITLSSELLDVLESYSWPGNIRELQNVIERMVVTADTNILELRHLPVTLQSDQDASQPSFSIPMGMGLHEALASLEGQMLSKALSEASTTRQAAEILGVNHSTVVRKIKKHNLRENGRLEFGQGVSS